MGHLDLECHGHKSPVVPKGAAVVGARTAAAVCCPCHSASESESCEQEVGVGCDDASAAGKAAGESEDDITLGDLREQLCP